MIRVLIADDHALVRDGLRALLARADDVEVVAEAGDGHEAVERARETLPDIVLLDIAMPGLGGLEAVPLIQREAPRARILILTQYEHADYVRRFLRLGVAGYVLKKAAGADLLSAIRAAHRGGLVLDPAIAREALKDPDVSSETADDPYDSLTERERQVLKLVAEGRSSKEIAEALYVTTKTVVFHRQSIMDKLDLRSVAELTKYAVRMGLTAL